MPFYHKNYMNGVKISWSKHVDQEELHAKHGFKIGYNFIVCVEHHAQDEFKSLLKTLKSVKVLSESVYQYQHHKKEAEQLVHLAVTDDTEAVQFKMSII